MSQCGHCGKAAGYAKNVCWHCSAPPVVKVGQVWSDGVYKLRITDIAGGCVHYYGGTVGTIHTATYPLDTWLQDVRTGRLVLITDTASAPKACDCGGEKCRTTCARWCSAYAP